MSNETLESLVMAAWKITLCVDQVNKDANFFDVGGTSLLLMKLQHELQMSFHRKFTALDLMRYPTVSEFVQWIIKNREDTLVKTD